MSMMDRKAKPVPGVDDGLGWAERKSKTLSDMIADI